MSIQVDAIVQNGMFMPKQPVTLPDGTEVTIAVVTRKTSVDPLAKVLGIDDGPAAGDVSDRHDDYLYGAR